MYFSFNSVWIFFENCFKNSTSGKLNIYLVSWTENQISVTSWIRAWSRENRSWKNSRDPRLLETQEYVPRRVGRLTVCLKLTFCVVISTHWGENLLLYSHWHNFDNLKNPSRISHNFDKTLANFSSANISKNILIFGPKFFLETYYMLFCHFWKFCQDLRCFKFFNFYVVFM